MIALLLEISIFCVTTWPHWHAGSNWLDPFQGWRKELSTGKADCEREARARKLLLINNHEGGG